MAKKTEKAVVAPPITDAAAKMKALETTMGRIQKQFGKGAIMNMADDAVEDVSVIPSGSLTLDIALGVGGYPRGRIIEVFGPESSGKTTLAIHAIAEAQKLGGIAAIIDAEHAFDPTYAQALGVDISRLWISQPDDGEQALDIAEQLIRSSAVDILVVDSVAALTPKAEIEGEMGDTQVGLHARLMSRAMRKITAAVSRSKTCCIFINQLRMKISSGYSPTGPSEVTTGGNALKFYSSVRLDIRAYKQIKKGDDVIGKVTSVRVIKNKVAPPFRRAEFDILFGKGINRIGEIIDAATDMGILKKSGSWYSYQGNNIGQGRDAVRDLLEDNPELADEVAQQVMEQLQHEGKLHLSDEVPEESEELDTTDQLVDEDFDM
ncbi:MAG: recombinase RecA [Porphyromonas sp.]|uniref:recombinase RecA n=1 Tax=Porphyromonas sp. TaxID=1924944 RepID=UPI001A4070DD|nr:recombinase RecA [Porphyromonas sp.]MBL6452680.1 recombinase RecA [Porphyromonas sp.]